MKKRKILILSKYFYPENTPRAFRTTELAIEMARQGHQVEVITPYHMEHKSFGKKYNIDIEDLGKQYWKPIVLKGSGLKLKIRRALRRLLQILIEYPDLELTFLVKKFLKKKLELKVRYDLLISIAVPHSIHWGVAAIWNKKSKLANTWVADCGDPFMGQENDTFKHPFYFQYIEKWFCEKVDYLSVPVKTAIPAYYPEFHNKIIVIPQGFRFEEVIRKAPSIRDYQHFAYAGGLIPGRRDPKEFLEFLLTRKENYRFDIYTKQKHLIKKYAERSKGRIVLKDYLPRLELLAELSKLDFMVNFENAGQKQIPSKLIDYVIIKKPILSVSSSTFDEKPVIEFLEGDYTHTFKIGNPEQYEIKNIVKKFITLAKI